MRQLLFLLSFFLPVLACAQSGFVVSGTVRGANDSTKVYLCQTLSDYPTDSTYIIGERFTFKGNLEHPIEYTVQIHDAEDEEESKECIFWLENSRIAISGSLDDFSNAKVSGSASQLSYVKYMTEVSKVAEERNSSYFDSVSLRLTESFIRKYPTSFKSVQELFLLRQSYPFSRVKQLYAALSPAVKQSKYGRELQSFIQSYTPLKKGDKAPDFTFIGMDGKVFNLKSLKGKYVLLVFWAPWCAPCRSENKQYNHIYSIRDTSKLVMLGICLDRKDEVVAAIKKDSIHWQNMVLSGNGDDMYANSLLYRYGIWSVPNNVLIDPQGKIIGSKLTPYYEEKPFQSEGGVNYYNSKIKRELNIQLEQLKLISD